MSSGSSYVFVRDASGNWTEEQKLTAANGASGDFFGYSVSLYGDHALVGASGVGKTTRFGSVSLNVGSAFVFSMAEDDITVEQPLNTTVTDGGSIDFGPSIGGSPVSLEFTIRNIGSSELAGISINKDGVHAADFTVTSGPAATIPAGDTTSFTASFSAGATGLRSAAIHIPSNSTVPALASYDINLTGFGFSSSEDADSDGLSDAAEAALAALGFDWQVSQPELVGTLFENANLADLYTPEQVQALHAPLPLIGLDPATGRLRLTMDWKISPDLENYVDLPANGPRSSVWVNGEGDIELQYEPGGDAAFFRVGIR